MENIQEYIKIFDNAFLGISMGRYIGAFVVVAISFLIKRIIKFIVKKVLVPLAQKTKGEFDDILVKALEQPVSWLVVIIGFFLAIEILSLPTTPVNIKSFAVNIMKVLITLDIVWVLFNLVDIINIYLVKWVNATESELDDHLAPFVRKGLKAFIVFIAVLMAIQNLGYSVSGLLAAGGIGGIAIALAARETLGNVFASIQLLADRPFHVGDWILADGIEGTVEEIGLRSTAIRSFPQTLIKVPNSILANAAINNFSRMPKRRIKMNIGVSYATTPNQMREAVSSIRQMLSDHPAIDQDFFLVNFTDFGASSLDIMVYCFSTTIVWQKYLDVRQDVCLQIMEILEEMGLEIAFPTRSIYLHSDSVHAIDQANQ